MPSPRRVKKSVRKVAKKSVRKSARKGVKKSVLKSAKKSVRKTKRSYRMDPPRNGPAPEWPISTPPEQRFARELIGRRDESSSERVPLLDFPRRERDPEEDRQERVRRLIENAREGNGTSADAYALLTPEEKRVIDNIYAEQRPMPAAQSSRPIFNKALWDRNRNRPRTPAQIARYNENRQAEQRGMKCTRRGCPLYDTWSSPPHFHDGPPPHEE